MTEAKATEPAGACKGFNYCFWAKLLVAIPAIPILVLSAAAHFTSLMAQLAAAGIAGFLVAYLAVKIDRLPVFSRMICKGK